MKKKNILKLFIFSLLLGIFEINDVYAEDIYKVYNEGQKIRFCPKKDACYEWIVVGDSGGEGQYVYLLMNEEFKVKQAYENIQSALNNFTSDWTNVENINGDQSCTMYGNICSQRASVLSAFELSSLVRSLDNNGAPTTPANGLASIYSGNSLKPVGDNSFSCNDENIRNACTLNNVFWKNFNFGNGFWTSSKNANLEPIVLSYEKKLVSVDKDSAEYFIRPLVKVNKQNLSTIKILEDEIKLEVNDSHTLKNEISSLGTAKITWKSSNEDIATIDNNGKIIAKKAGTVEITATIDDANMDRCLVTVTPKVINDSITIHRADKYKYTIENAIIEKFTSSNNEIVEVTENNEIYGKKSGTAILTSKNNYYDITLNVTVNANTVYEKGNLITLKVGETYVFENINSLGNINWNSSNNEIVSIDSNGKITALKEGSAVIKGTNDSYEFENNIIVLKSDASKENVVTDNINLAVNKKLDLTTRTTFKNLNWTSSNSNVVSVDSNGVITTLKEGSVVITGANNTEKYIVEVNVYSEISNKLDDNQTIAVLKNDKLLEDDVTLKIERKDSNNDEYKKFKNILSKANKFEIYDIDLIKDDKKVQPDGEVVLEFNIPVGFDKTKIAVFRVEENGSFTKLSHEIVNDKIQVKTSHFSNYIIAEVENEKVTEEIIENSKKQNKELENPATGAVLPITIVAIALVVIGGIYYYTKKKNKFVKM